MSAQAYLDAAAAALKQLRETQKETLRQAALTFVEAIEGGNKLFAFGATHSFIIAEELCYRTGGLMLVNPIYPHGMNLSVRPMTMTSQLERLEGLGEVLLSGAGAEAGDVLLIASTSGRNPIVIDMALAARTRSVTTIAITSAAYSGGVPSRHSSGKLLHEVCDQVIDQCTPLGDAAVAVAGFAQKVGPLSTVLGCAAANALVCEVVDELVRRGITPPVFISANMPGGDDHNAGLLAENAGRIDYM